jgi:hypothetical protein
LYNSKGQQVSGGDNQSHGGFKIDSKLSTVH